MKILFLNPYIDAEHNFSRALQSKGLAILFPADVGEAVQMLRLHGTSIDLAIVHREGYSAQESDFGLKFISKAKADPSQVDLAIILTTQKWSDAECSQHQQGPEGVNAYLKYPFELDQLVQVIEAVTGQTLSTSPSEESSGPVLEDASEVFLRPEVSISSSLSESIVLEAPDFSSELSQNPQPSLQIEVSEIEVPAASESLSGISVPTAIEIQESEIQIPIAEESTADSKESNDSIPVADLSAILDVPAAIEVLHEQNHPQTELELSQVELSQSDESEVAQEMPYLFSESRSPSFNTSNAFVNSHPALIFAEPLGDAVVPGGAAQSPDAETLKKYLLLREQDVGVLSSQLGATQDQIKLLEQLLKEEKGKNVELSHVVAEQKRKIDDSGKEKASEIDGLQADIDELKFQVKVKNDRGRVFETQAREAAEEMDRLKERVRNDIRKIRVREKELENRLEILKKDSEALISSREGKIIELKRKLDLLEFNMDLLQVQYTKEKENSTKLRERLARAAQVVKVAGGLLDSQKGVVQFQEDETSETQEKGQKVS
jgi:hypothetical protein